MRILLSGPLGSGKSTVAARLAELGAAVIEADRLGHAVLEPGAEAFADVAARWPEVVGDGRIDRTALAAIVFADPEELRRLEAITHPPIVARIRRAVVSLEATADVPVIVVELPLLHDLLGSGWHRLVVLAPDTLRLDRAVARGMSEPDARRRMAAQPPADAWEASADSVIHNDADVPTLRTRIDTWWSTCVNGESAD